MKRTLTALTLAATMFASSASAFNPDDLQKLEDTGDCEFCDLRDANLNGAILIDANLSYAVLYGADLSYANLFGANLANTELINANLGGANLEGAELRYANMNGAILCNTTVPDGSVIYSGC